MKTRPNDSGSPANPLEEARREILRLQTEYYSDRRWLGRMFFGFLAVASVILVVLYGATTQEIGSKIKEAMGSTAMQQASDSVLTLMHRIAEKSNAADSLTQLLTMRAGFRLTTGSTDPDNTAWKEYARDALQLDIDVSQYRFGSTPIFLTTLKGESSHFATTGITSIYAPSPTGFTVYLRSVGPIKEMLAEAKRAKWHVQWVALTANSDTRQ